MASAAGRDRLPAIDHLKAAAIVAVVFTHSGRRTFAGAHTEWDLYLTSVWVRFHVPTFLFVSGFLYARSTRDDLASVRARLARVLVPYLLASFAAQAVGMIQVLLGKGNGITGAHSLGDVAFQLATASSLGIYYYVFVLVLCIPLVWPLARAPLAAVWAAWGTCVALTAAVLVDPGLRPTRDFFWSMRNPLDDFFLGFFLSGWLAALVWPRIEALYRRHPRGLTGASAAGVVYAWAVNAHWLPVDDFLVTRILYTFAAIGSITLLTWRRVPGPVVRFLSEATLSLYLYHHIFQRLTEPATWEWHPVARIAAQVAAGLAGACAVALAGRRLLGPQRARLLLGT